MVREVLARNDYQSVFAVSRRATEIDGAVPLVADLSEETSLSSIAKQVAAAGPCCLCIVAIGTLSDGEAVRPERSYHQQSRDAFERLFNVNVILPALIAKHIMPLAPRNQRAIFAALSARVGSIEDNKLGGWHAYRASKAALNMLIKNYAIEQKHRSDQFLAVGLHPGTVNTQLSRPFQSNIPSGQLFSPKRSAKMLLDVLAGLNPSDSGRVFDWAGKEIPA